jgi:hypothetical protein
MPGELMPSPRDAMHQLRGTNPLARRLPKEVRQARNRIAAKGFLGGVQAQAAEFVTEARIDAVEQVTERTMIALERLGHVEASMVRGDPIRAERFAGLVDDFLLIARTELRRLPDEF